MDPNNPNQPQGQTPPNYAQQPVGVGAPPFSPAGQPAAPQATAQPNAYQQQASPASYQQPASQPAQPAQPTPAATGKANKSNPASTQNLLKIAEIRDGLVIMSDGSFRAVVMVKSINFDLMSPNERDAVELGYQSFLNSLYFPMQIYIKSQKVDLRPYLEKLNRIRQEHENMLLSLLMEDYLLYIEQLAAQTNIMSKEFYIVIPYFTSADVQKVFTQSKNFFTGLTGLFGNKEQHVVINEQELAKAKDELRNRVQAVLGGLRQCNVPGLPLDTQELIELYYDTYNPDTATRQQLKNFDDLTAPVVTKGEGQARQPSLEKELPQ